MLRPDALFRTASGLWVTAGSHPPEFRDGKWKVPAWRNTGGFHGWLKLSNLSPLNSTAKALVAKHRGA